MFAAERHDDGAREGREIDHELRLEALLAVAYRVRQHEPSFGVGVEDLDGPPA